MYSNIINYLTQIINQKLQKFKKLYILNLNISCNIQNKLTQFTYLLANI